MLYLLNATIVPCLVSQPGVIPSLSEMQAIALRANFERRQGDAQTGMRLYKDAHSGASATIIVQVTKTVRILSLQWRVQGPSSSTPQTIESQPHTFCSGCTSMLWIRFWIQC